MGANAIIATNFMRIAFFHELSEGGARRSVREFGKALKKNHLVDLYFVDSKDIKDASGYFSNVFFFKFKEKEWRGKDWKAKLYKDTVELYNLYILHRKIASIIDSKKYDVAIVQPSRFTQAPFILKFLKTKKIYYCQEPLRMIYDSAVNSLEGIKWPKIYYEKLIRGLRKQIDRDNLMYADKILANSKFSRRNIQKAYRKDAEVCYMGVDTKAFSPLKVSKKVDVLYIGAYDPVDGMGLFEKTLKKTKEPMSVKILAREKKWIRKDTELRDLYNSAKLALCISYNEPFGLIPLEAMACQTPVIALDQGGYKESVKNGKTGFLAKNNPEELAKILKKLLRNDTRLIKLGKAARDDMQSNWQWRDCAKKLEEHAKALTQK